jgi:hypothetical protein
MLKIELDSEIPSYVLINLFLDAIRKFGKYKEVKSMTYDVENGLVVVDANDVIWNLEVNAKVILPDELIESVSDNNAHKFCVECDRAMDSDEEVCGVCQYLNKI